MTEPASLPFDYHSHHHRCGHAAGEMSDYIEAAIAQGMIQFGVSDHGPAYFLPGDHPLPQTQMALSELPCYVAEGHALKEQYADRLRILVGVEADWIEGLEGELQAILESQNFDYALGSVHYAFGRSIFDKQRWLTDNAPATYAEYYRLVALAARSGLFDILSHLTAIEAYGPPLSDELAAELYPPVADAVATAGCIVEVNTSGYRKMRAEDGGPGGEPFPNRRMLRLLIERGVPLTFGSDCHRPDEVSYGSAKVRALLEALNVATDQPVPITVRRRPILALRTGAR